MRDTEGDDVELWVSDIVISAEALADALKGPVFEPDGLALVDALNEAEEEKSGEPDVELEADVLASALAEGCRDIDGIGEDESTTDTVWVAVGCPLSLCDCVGEAESVFDGDSLCKGDKEAVFVRDGVSAIADGVALTDSEAAALADAKLADELAEDTAETDAIEADAEAEGDAEIDANDADDEAEAEMLSDGKEDAEKDGDADGDPEFNAELVLDGKAMVCEGLGDAVLEMELNLIVGVTKELMDADRVTRDDPEEMSEVEDRGELVVLKLDDCDGEAVTDALLELLPEAEPDLDVDTEDETDVLSEAEPLLQTDEELLADTELLAEYVATLADGFAETPDEGDFREVLVDDVDGTFVRETSLVLLGVLETLAQDELVGTKEVVERAVEETL